MTHYIIFLIWFFGTWLYIHPIFLFSLSGGIAFLRLFWEAPSGQARRGTRGNMATAPSIHKEKPHERFHEVSGEKVLE